jgi:hypothetical protein
LVVIIFFYITLSVSRAGLWRSKKLNDAVRRRMNALVY